MPWRSRASKERDEVNQNREPKRNRQRAHAVPFWSVGKRWRELFSISPRIYLPARNKNGWAEGISSTMSKLIVRFPFKVRSEDALPYWKGGWRASRKWQDQRKFPTYERGRLERKRGRADEGTMYYPQFSIYIYMYSDLSMWESIRETYLEKFLTLHDEVAFFFSFEFVVVCKADDVE